MMTNLYPIAENTKSRNPEIMLETESAAYSLFVTLNTPPNISSKSRPLRKLKKNWSNNILNFSTQTIIKIFYVVLIVVMKKVKKTAMPYELKTMLTLVIFKLRQIFPIRNIVQTSLQTPFDRLLDKVT